MPRLAISLLGNFAVSLDDTPVDGFAYDKVRALLAYLAVEHNHAHHREHVADLLWPGYPTRSARQNLSQALSTLRGALGDRDNDPPFLLVNHREIQFNGASDTWLDVSELIEHLDAVQTHVHANLADCAVCRGHLEQATALYRGDFLDDLLLDDSAPFEEWSLLQRESLRRQILDALEHLTESYLQRGEADAALHHARRQLALDAWREPAHRQVMRALVLSGQRNAAIAHYEECRRLLAAGLGVEPETATLELAAALKSRTLSGSTQIFAEDARADQVMIGKPVGNYLIVAYLGQGGMAQVYKAYHTRLARYVALKFIRPELLQADALRAFEQEAKTLARLNHPNVVQVYDFGELGESARQPYLVMEYIAGETLKEWLPEDQPLPLEQAWPILQQISAAVDHAHAQGIIHRDIKPGNVMLTSDGHALLSDFGISKLLRPGEEAAYTVATTGTPAYMAPEQVDLDLGPISPATDVYALGIVAYEMLTGKHPFQGVTPISEMLQRIQSPPTPPRHYNPALPEAVERVLLTVLSKAPDSRYPRAGAFMRALAAAAPELVVKAEGQPAAHTPAWWSQLTAEPAPEPGDPPFMGLQHFDVADADLFFGREALTTRLLRQLFLAQSPAERPTPEHLRDVEIKRGAQSRFLAIVGASGSGKSSLARAGLAAAVQRGEILAGSEHWPVHVLTPTAHPLESLALALTQGNESVTAATTLMDDMTRDPRSLHLYLKKQEAGSKKQEARNKGQESRIENQESSIPQSATHNPHILVIDQFEEVFTLCHNADERQAFIASLLTAAGISRTGDGEPNGKVFVLLTLRADFYDHCAQYPDLREALGRHQVYIGPLTPDGLRRAIEEPATRHQWAFEPGLVDLMLRDIGADGMQSPEPGALPLLSHALLETWKRRRGRTLTLGGYAEAGGVRGAIAKTADAVYATLTPAQQTLARTLFLRLTELGEGTQDTRRRVAHGEILSDAQTAPAVKAVLDILANARLITLEKDVVQVAHEALIREWPTLREWLEEDREGLRVYRHLTESALEWERLGRDPGDLYRGARLAQAIEWAAVHPEAVNPLERAYLSASQADAQRIEREREAQRQRELEAARKLAEAEKARAEEGQAAARKLRLRARSLAVAAVGILCVAIIAVLLWNQARLTSQENATLASDNANIAATAVAVSELEAEQRAAAEEARIEADAQRVAAEAAEHEALIQASVGLAARALDELNGVSPERAVLLALAALDEYPYTPQAESALGRAVYENRPYTVLSDPGGSQDLSQAAWSPDRKYIAVSEQFKQDVAVIWDVETAQIVQHLPWDAERASQCTTVDVAWSPAGDRVVLATYSNLLAKCDTVQVWDVASGEPILPLSGEGRWPWSVDWSPDGSTILAAYNDGMIRTWSANTGDAQLAISMTTSWVKEAVWSPSGSHFATASGDGLTHVWTTAGNSEILTLTGHVDAVNSIAWSPDEAYLATAGRDGTVRVWNMTNGEITLTLAGHAGGKTGNIGWSATGVLAVAWSPDGARIATAGNDRTVRVWNAITGEELLKYYGVTNAWHVAWSPDSKHLAIRGGEETRILDLSTEPLRLYGHPDEAWDAQWSPDGTRIATGGAVSSNQMENPARVWDAASGKELSQISQSFWTFLAWAPDGKRLITGGNPAQIWDAETGELIKSIPYPTAEGWFYMVSWSPDGAQIATSNIFEFTVSLYDAATGDLVRTIGEPDCFKAADWSPDSTRIATGCYIGQDEAAPVRIWNAATGEELLAMDSPGGQTTFVKWSPDGTKLASGHTGGMAMVWDTSTGENLVAFAGHDDWVWDVTWSPNGKRIASSDISGIVKVWDATTGTEVLSFQAPNEVLQLDWSPDGNYLTVAGKFNEPMVQRVWQSTKDLIAYAYECCVFRELTPEERAQFMLGTADHD